MLLVIDNYDSFVFNIVRYCEELGQEIVTIRNDKITLAAIRDLKPQAIIISPGPCTPDEAGISLSAIQQFSGVLPILGICLGHQCIGAVFGGEVVRAQKPMHGRSSLIEHTGNGLFSSLPKPLEVGRYHSLIVESRPAMEQSLRVDAVSLEGEIMALSHATHPTFGVQFHPESVLTECGYMLFRNFFELQRAWSKGAQGFRPDQPVEALLPPLRPTVTEKSL